MESEKISGTRMMTMAKPQKILRPCFSRKIGVGATMPWLPSFRSYGP